MQRARMVNEGVSTLTHTVRSGDRGGSGSSISVSEDR
jgi:type IV secretion system protein TrbL